MPPSDEPSCLNIQGWRASTPEEVLEYFDPDQPREGRQTRHMLVVRSHLRPIDLYCYLVARFGQPNGFQNFLRRDDSDNLIHWDFNLKAHEIDVYLAGASREIHISVTEELTDEQWKALIIGIRDSYGRVGKQKSAVLKSLEKYVVFQNKFVSLADLCADLHAVILDAPTFEQAILKAGSKEDIAEYTETVKRASARASDLYGNCLKLRLLTPIMAEAYINMIILMFCKDVIRKDKAKYQEFLRARIPDRLYLLTRHCDGFARHIDKTTDAYANFMRVIDKRNFALHGNVNPIEEQLEVVYFDKRRPLFVNPGNNVEKLREQLESVHDPQQVIADYETVQIFLLEIMECLMDRYLAYFEQVIGNAFPGFDVKRERVTRLLPDHAVLGIFEGIRYDDQLNVEW
jgi:hypothetical protein